MSESFDFIVVGGGTSGCVIASRLAETPSAPKVLLIEAGGPNDDPAVRAPALRYAIPFTQPPMVFADKSIPQKQLNGQVIPYPHGRGLGGSSAANFCVWLLGHKEDWNYWAELVGDDAWKWDGPGGVKQRFRKIENLQDDIGEEFERYVGREPLRGHSKEGKVRVSYNKQWNEVDTLGLEAGLQYNGQLNTDVNNGDPTGFGMGPTSYYNGLRSTAATSYLANRPSNLTIKTDQPIAKVLFDDSKRAIGVQTVSGEVYYASKETILSGGALGSPKLLLLSGIGPAGDLNKFSIPIIHEVPGVGQHLIDHAFVTTTLLRKDRHLPVDYDFHGTTGFQAPAAFLSDEKVKSSAEFAALGEKTKAFLEKVPTYEWLLTPLPLVGAPTGRENAEVITLFIANMNAQSEGSISLASSNPNDDVLLDLNYFAHPYDRRVVIEGLRALQDFIKVPALADVTEKVIEAPTGLSDEELFDHCKKSVQPVWHFGGTCRMGKDEGSVVDNRFRVKGVEGLRVADHSIAPLMTNNHTQTTCYMIGETAAEKLIAEYEL